MSMAPGLKDGAGGIKASAAAAVSMGGAVEPASFEEQSVGDTVNIAHVLSESPMTGLMKGKGKTIKMELAKGLRLAYDILEKKAVMEVR